MAVGVKTAEELRVAMETAHGLGRLTTAHCRAKQSMMNALEAGLDCIEHPEFLVPGDIVEYGAGVSSSGIIQYDPRVTERILRQETFVSFTFQAGGYDTLVELRAKREQERLSPAEQRRRDALEGYYGSSCSAGPGRVDDDGLDARSTSPTRRKSRRVVARSRVVRQLRDVRGWLLRGEAPAPHLVRHDLEEDAVCGHGVTAPAALEVGVVTLQ